MSITKLGGEFRVSLSPYLFLLYLYSNVRSKSLFPLDSSNAIKLATAAAHQVALWLELRGQAYVTRMDLRGGKGSSERNVCTLNKRCAILRHQVELLLQRAMDMAQWIAQNENTNTIIRKLVRRQRIGNLECMLRCIAFLQFCFQASNWIWPEKRSSSSSI